MLHCRILLMRLGMAQIGQRLTRRRPASAGSPPQDPGFSGRAAVAGLATVLVLTLVAGVSPSFAQQTANGFRVVPIVREDKVYVTFDLASGFTEDVRAAIQSGLKTTFTYDVELRLDVPGWVDRTVGTSTVTATVEYNNLLRRYTLTRVVDGREDQQEQADSEAKVRQWMTSLKGLPLFDTRILETNRDYYVRVHATARPTNGSMLWPFGSGTSAMAKFTFIR
jgi:hypothetical protein